MKIKKKTLIRVIRNILNESIGVDQSIGMGKNYHTLNPDPITWENYPGLEYSIAGDPAGYYYAKVKVTGKPKLDSYTRKFEDEDSAMFWIRTQFEKLHRKSLNSN